MVAELQLFQASGLVLTEDSGTHAFSRVILCGVSNGSVVIPIQVKSDGSLVTSGA